MPLAREVRARFIAEVEGLRNGFQSVKREAEALGPATKRSTDAASRNYDKLGQTVEDLKTTLEKTGKVELFQDLDKTADRARREFKAVGAVSEETMQSLEKAINQATDTLGDMAPEARATFGEIESVIADTRNELKTFTQATEGAADALNDLGNVDNLNDAAQQIGEVSDSLNDLEDSANNAQDSMQDMANGVESEAGRVEQSIGGIGNSVEDMANTVQEESSNAADSIGSIQDSMQDVSRSVSSDAGDIGRNIGTMGRNVVDSTSRAFDTAAQHGERFRQRMDNLNPFADIEREARALDRTIGRPIANLPDHLRPFRDELTEVRTDLRELGRSGGQSIDQLSEAAIRSGVAASGLTSMTDSGKEAAKIVQELTTKTREAQLAVMGLNEDGTIQLTTAESEQRLQSFRSEIDRTRERLETLRDAGDMGSFVAGMRVVEQSLLDVDLSMQATARGGGAYNRMLREMGIYTSDSANQMGIDMERYRTRFMTAVDMMNSRSGLAKKMMDFLPQSSRIQSLDRFFLNIANNLDTTARKGSAANLAIEMLGRDAPMKKIMDLTRMINQGVMGVQQMAMGASIVFAGFTLAMAKAASGPSPSEVAGKQAEALALYQEEVQKRTDEIMKVWSAFEDIQLKALSPEPLRENLQEQVDVLGKWESDLNDLQARTNNVDLMRYLRGLGPKAAMEIQALNDHTDEGLSEWVKLWEEKNEIATRAAMSELEWMKVQTDAKIKALQDSLTPLSIAWENFLQTWAKAMGPFVQTWGVVAAKAVDGATAIGEFINKLNEMNPQISAAIGMFTYLFSALILILSPLGVGIGLLKGMRANFHALYMMFGPAITAFFRVAGAATGIAGALVGLGLVFYNLWTSSEKLRNSLTSAWEQISGAIKTALSVVEPSIQQLKDSFVGIFASVLDDAGGFKLTWEGVGDAIAGFVDKVMTQMPIFREGLNNSVTAAITIIGWLIAAFGKIHEWWTTYGPAIVNTVGQAFGAVIGLIQDVIRKIAAFFNSDGKQILDAFKNIFSPILAIVSAVFKGIWEVIKFVMPAVLVLIKMIWSNITGVINGALDVIFGLIKVFAGLFTGDFGKMWEGIKQVFSGAMEFLFNAVQLTFYGKLLSGAKFFFIAFRSGFTSLWNAIKSIFSGNGQAVLVYLQRAWREMYNATTAVWNGLTGFFKSIWSGITGVFTGVTNGLAGILTGTWANILAGLKIAWAGIRTFASSAANLVVRGIVTAFGVLGIDIGAKMQQVVAILSAVWSVIKSSASAAWSGIKTVAAAAWSGIVSVIGQVAGTAVAIVTGIWGGLKSAASTAFAAIVSVIGSVFGTVYAVVTTIVNGIKTRFTDGWNAIKNATSTAVKANVDVVKNIWQGLVSFFGPFLKGLGDIFKAGWTFISDVTKSIFNGIRDFLKMLWDAMTQTLSVFINGFVQVGQELFGKFSSNTKNIFNDVKKFLTDLWNAIVNTIGGIINTLVTRFTTGWDRIKTATSTAFNAIKSFLEPFWNGIVTFVTTVVGTLLTRFKTGWDNISNATQTSYNAIKKFITDLWNGLVTTVTNILSTLLTRFKTGWSNISTATSTSYNAVKKYLTDLWNGLVTTIGGILTTLYNRFKSGWDSISTTTSSVFGAIKTYLTNTWNTIVSTIRGIIDALVKVFFGGFKKTETDTKSTTGGLKSWLTDTWNNIKSFFSTTLGQIGDKIKSTWNTALSNTKTAFGNIYDEIKKKFNSIVDTAKGLPGRISDGLKSMASKVGSGVNSVVNTMGAALERGVNGVIAGVNAVLGALGVSTRIQKISVPRYHQGTDDDKGAHPGGPAIVGDGIGTNAGAELIETPDGKSFLSPKKPTLMNLPEGTKVWSATETRELAKMGHIPKYAFGDALRSAADWVKGKVASGVSALMGMLNTPRKMLESAMNVMTPSGSGFIGGVAKGGFNKAKDGAVSYITKKIKAYKDALAAAAANGTTVTSGGGGSFGAPFRLTSKPGPRPSPGGIGSTNHKGWDWAAPAGTPIPAQQAGKIVYVGFQAQRGNYVKLRSGAYDYIYQHNSRNAVTTGQQVKKGQTLGYVGSTGASTGPHVHYEIQKYEDGGIALSKQLAWVADGGWAESIISHDPAKHSTQQAIWQKTGETLGFMGGGGDQTLLLALLQRIANATEAGHVLVADEQVLAEVVKDPLKRLMDLDDEIKGQFG